MRYYESAYERFLSKLPPPGKGVKLKDVVMDEDKYNLHKKRYVWTEQDLQSIKVQRANSVSYQIIADQFKTTTTTIRNLCKRHGFKSPKCYIPSLKSEPLVSKP